jgi:hypothetical protein
MLIHLSSWYPSFSSPAPHPKLPIQLLIECITLAGTITTAAARRLSATLAGLATCTLSHLTELEASRNIIRALIGGSGNPQLLIRIGEVPALSDQPPATPRRPLAEVLEVREPAEGD